STKSSDGKIAIDLAAGLTDAQRKPIRNASMRYADELRTGLKLAVDAKTWKLLNSRYRFAMADVVNAERKVKGKEPLDPSPVLLPHPRLDLYVDMDSKHPFDSDPTAGKMGVGCTSCHDGSGQETDFVLTAHVARNIWVDQSTGEPVLASQLKQS